VADRDLRDLLRVLERPADPEQAFADSLYEQLAVEAGFRGAAGTVARPWAGMGAFLRPMRLVWIAVVLILLLALTVGLVVFGGWTRSPADIVERSQAVFRAPPPFAMTTRFTNGSQARYLYNGSAVRFEVTVGGYLDELPEGWFTVTDADRIGRFDPGDESWGVGRNDVGRLFDQLHPSWVAPIGYGPGEEPPLVSCGSWELGEPAEVAGRTADEVRCGADRYWVDRASGMLVKREAAASSDWPLTEVIALEINPDLPPELFAFEPPPGARDEADPMPLHPTSEVLAIGQEAPELNGTLIDGSPFSTNELRGQPAAIFFWCSCAPGPQVRIFLTEAAARADSMGLVVVSLEREGTTQGLVEWLDVQTPVLNDASWSAWDTWQLLYFPSMVLLRADGTVADLHAGTFDAEKLAAILDALASGGPIPEPNPWPVVERDAEGRVPLSTVLEIGEVAPELRGPRLGGGELSTLDLRGKPTAVVQWWSPPDPETGPQSDDPPPDRLLAEIEARGGTWNLLLVAMQVSRSDAVPLYLEQHDSDAPVIFDYDGMLLNTWGLVAPTLVLLDADGRVAGYYGSEALRDPGPLLDALEAGQPLPTPYPPGI
jgi:hypothetical protein